MKNEDLKMGIYGTFKVSKWQRVDVVVIKWKLQTVHINLKLSS